MVPLAHHKPLRFSGWYRSLFLSSVKRQGPKKTEMQPLRLGLETRVHLEVNSNSLIVTWELPGGWPVTLFQLQNVSDCSPIRLQTYYTWTFQVDLCKKNKFIFAFNVCLLQWHKWEGFTLVSSFIWLCHSFALEIKVVDVSKATLWWPVELDSKACSVRGVCLIEGRPLTFRSKDSHCKMMDFRLGHFQGPFGPKTLKWNTYKHYWI